jgi:hypothetical protein
MLHSVHVNVVEAKDLPDMDQQDPGALTPLPPQRRPGYGTQGRSQFVGWACISQDE